MGNTYRRDDAVGLFVARAVRRMVSAFVTVLEREGEPTSLIEAWERADAVWLVDAVAPSSGPGTVHRFEATAHPLPATFAKTSTHHFGLPEAVELARALGRLPQSLVVYGIEGSTFDVGDVLTPAVARTVETVAVSIRDEIAVAAPTTP